jgi:predicted ferric reductase
MSSVTVRPESSEGRAGEVPRPAPSGTLRLTAADVIGIIIINAGLVVAMWIRHGALNDMASLSAQLTAAGQITALVGTYCALVQIFLMSRSPWLERTFGIDQLAFWHKWLGFSVVILISAHVVFTTTGYALGDGSSVVAEVWTFTTTYPYVLMAVVAFMLFLGVAGTSMRFARRRISYDTWRFIHNYGYLAIALAFGHQLAVGNDLTNDPVARWYWISLYIALGICLLVFRVGQPLVMSLRHQLRVAEVVSEAPGVVSLYVTGRKLDQIPARGGQYFRWRFFTPDGWWRTHPFSISATPNGEFIRVTIKDLGDGSRGFQGLHAGTRIGLEGPYGVFTADRRTRTKALLIAGGIGITPLRAILEDIPARRDGIILIYRATAWEDVVFRNELETLMRERRGTIHYLIGQRGAPDMPNDPLSVEALRLLVPDIAARDVFVCGPDPMMMRVVASLHDAGVPDTQIHFERFAVM